MIGDLLQIFSVKCDCCYFILVICFVICILPLSVIINLKNNLQRKIESDETIHTKELCGDDIFSVCSTTMGWRHPRLSARTGPFLHRRKCHDLRG